MEITEKDVQPTETRFWIRSFPIAAPLSNWVERLLPASRLQELPKRRPQSRIPIS